MRATKTTKLSFGLVKVGVRVYNATESQSVSFNTFHTGCGGAVGNRKYCKCCDTELAANDIIKGKVIDDRVVTVSDDELETLQAIRDLHNIEIMQFCQADEIDPTRLEASYYLEPTESGGEGYALLRQVMVEAGLVAVVRFVLRTRQTLAVIKISGDVMVMQAMCWPGELRGTGALRRLDTPISDQRLVRMAHNVVKDLTEPFNPNAYNDEYSAAVSDLVAAKATGKTLAPHQGGVEDVSDLIAALEASVARHPAKKTKPSRITPHRKAS